MTQERRCAVVTGAGSGIGAATVAALAREGWRVACLDRDGAGAARTAESAGDDHVAVQVDVTEEAGVAAAFERCAALLGRVDGLATCAGIVDATPFLELDAATFRRVYDVNVVGTFL